MRIIPRKFLECPRQFLAGGHCLKPRGADDVGKADMPGLDPSVQIDLLFSPALVFVRRLDARIRRGVRGPAALVAAETRNHAAGTVAGATEERQRGEGRGIQIIIAPVISLFESK